MFLHQFGKFEESITGVYTYQTRKRNVEDIEYETSEHNLLDFSAAILKLKSGKKIQRSGWNGKGMYLRYVDLYSDKSFSVTEHEPIDGTLSPWIGMKTVDNRFVPWLASQTDILAEDWQIVE